MQQWKITVEFYPGETLERDRWWWQIKEYGQIAESSGGSDPEFICEDIAVALNKLVEVPHDSF
ncbi:hypothetical protein phiPsal1_032 [Pontimonas phage phiPsal1]|nr:hypothetical protein phiPsal1_032 [Pontimonas phage phiPsal1]